MLPKKFSSVELADRIAYLIEHFQQAGQDELDVKRIYTFTQVLDTSETETATEMDLEQEIDAET
jgi:hypothetical protein